MTNYQGTCNKHYTLGEISYDSCTSTESIHIGNEQDIYFHKSLGLYIVTYSTTFNGRKRRLGEVATIEEAKKLLKKKKVCLKKWNMLNQKKIQKLEKLQLKNVTFMKK